MLEVRQLTVRYAGQERLAVRDLSFSLAPGETVGLCGPSGCGKSSVARAIAGLLPASATIRGAITFQGEPLLTASAGALRRLRGRRIAILLQEPALALNPFLPIGRQAQLLLGAHAGSTPRWLHEILHRLLPAEPASFLSRYPSELSGGERQRIAIALALAHRPDLLIADEPTTALDAEAQRDLLDLLRALQSELGLALLLISHDPAVLRYCGARPLVLPAEGAAA